MIATLLRENGDALAIAVLLAVLVAVAAIWSAHPIEWFRQEWRLAWKNDFWPETEHAEHVVNPALGSTRADPNVAHAEALQYQAGERMRKAGTHFLDRAFEPTPTVLRKP